MVDDFRLGNLFKLQLRDKKSFFFVCETLGKFRTSLLFPISEDIALKMLVGKSLFFQSPANRLLDNSISMNLGWFHPLIFLGDFHMSSMTYGGS